jgi:DNA-binding NarL/FixJ family response regulator
MQMGFFKYFDPSNYFNGKGSSRKVFIVEDNAIYAKALESYLRHAFPQMEIWTFDRAEVALGELHENPGIIIMDQFYNSKETLCLDTVKDIRARKVPANIMLLSMHVANSEMPEEAKKYRCHYVKKDGQTFNKVEEYIKQVWRS